MIPNPTLVNMTRMLKYVGPRGLNIIKYNYKGPAFFLAVKVIRRLRFGLVIGIIIDHPHTYSRKYAQYVELCGAQGHIFKYKGPAFSLQPKKLLGSGLV